MSDNDNFFKILLFIAERIDNITNFVSRLGLSSDEIFQIQNSERIEFTHFFILKDFHNNKGEDFRAILLDHVLQKMGYLYDDIRNSSVDEMIRIVSDSVNDKLFYYELCGQRIVDSRYETMKNRKNSEKNLEYLIRWNQTRTESYNEKKSKIVETLNIIGNRRLAEEIQNLDFKSIRS